MSWTFMIGLVPLREERDFSLKECHRGKAVWRHKLESGSLQSRNWVLTRHWICLDFDLWLLASRTMRNTFLLLMSYPSWCFVTATQMDWGITAELMAHNLIPVLNQLLTSFASLVFSCFAWPNTYTGGMSQLSIFSSANTYFKQPEKRTQLGILGTSVSSVTSVSLVLHATRQPY